MRRFADTARIPASPLWPIVAETAERTVDAWEGLEEKELLPGDMRDAIGKHILTVAATIRRARPTIKLGEAMPSRHGKRMRKLVVLASVLTLTGALGYVASSESKGRRRNKRLPTMKRARRLMPH